MSCAEVDADNDRTEAGQSSGCPTVAAGDVQHSESADIPRKQPAGEPGDEPLPVADPGGVPRGDLVVP